MTNDIVSSKIYDKWDDFNFLIEVFLAPLPLVYTFRFARVSSNVNDFNNGNNFMTSKLLKQGYRYPKLH